eukprot:g14027.t1
MKGYELGCRDWIHKPFCRQELIARVKSHLKMRSTLLRRWTAEGRRATGGIAPSNCSVMIRTRRTGRSWRYRLAAKKEAHEENDCALSDLAEEKQDNSFVTGPADTTVLFANVAAEGSVEGMASVFEDFERHSRQHEALRTEVFGSTYVAIAMGSEDQTFHTDKLLLLAYDLLQTTHKAKFSVSIGLHSEVATPRTVTGRQYPKSSFFSSTVQTAKKLSEAAAENRILLSRTARCRLSADVEAELQLQGLQLLEGDASAWLGEHFYVAQSSDSDSSPLKMPPEPKVQVIPSPEKEEMLSKTQMQVQGLQEDLGRA